MSSKGTAQKSLAVGLVISAAMVMLVLASAVYVFTTAIPLWVKAGSIIGALASARAALRSAGDSVRAFHKEFG